MGSEMCIRDRYTAFSVRTVDGELVLGEDWVQGPLPSTAAAEFHSCLLYTSDAADERSSVDLGGRRIIKNKTNERQ